MTRDDSKRHYTPIGYFMGPIVGTIIAEDSNKPTVGNYFIILIIRVIKNRVPYSGSIM
jgi:hypothetical protein